MKVYGVGGGLGAGGGGGGEVDWQMCTERQRLGSCSVPLMKMVRGPDTLQTILLIFVGSNWKIFREIGLTDWEKKQIIS